MVTLIANLGKKISKVLIIKELRPSLDTQETSVPLL